MDSALRRSWSKGFILANSPFQWLYQIVQKFILDKAQGTLFLPNYSSTCPSKETAYRGAMHCITLAVYTFPPHSKLFLRENGTALGPAP